MSNINELKPIISLNPFARFCCTIGNLPSSYMASLTYEEQLLWFCDYLQNTIIPAVNNNAEVVKELQELYVKLKNYVDNYFENLDVQDEINHKLDEMAQDGTLVNIISTYLNLNTLIVFNTVNDLKNANLEKNTNVKTLGYYAINDGGAGEYHITDTIDNLNYQETLNNGLYATLLYNNIVNVKQFGAKGDNIQDDTSYIQKAIDFANLKNSEVSQKSRCQITVFSPENQTYRITRPLNFTSSYVGFDFSNSTIIGEGSINCINIGNHDLESNPPYGLQIYYSTFKNLNIRAKDTNVLYGMFINAPWCIFENIEIRGDVLGTRKFLSAFYITESWDAYFFNCTATDINGIAFNSPKASNNVCFNRCTVQRTNGNAFDVRVALNIKFENCDCQFVENLETSNFCYYIHQCYGVEFNNIYNERFFKGVCITGGTRSVKFINSYFNFNHGETTQVNKTGILLETSSNISIGGLLENGISGDVGIDTNGNTNYVNLEKDLVFNNYKGTTYNSVLENIVFNNFIDYNRYFSKVFLNKGVQITKNLFKSSIQTNNLNENNHLHMKFAVSQNTNAFKITLDIIGNTSISYEALRTAKIVIAGNVFNNNSILGSKINYLEESNSGAFTITNLTFNSSTNTIEFDLNFVTSWTGTNCYIDASIISNNPSNIEAQVLNN